MARLIDADQMAVDESEAYMSAQVQIQDDLKWLINFAAHSKIQALIADTPTVDAVPVVRCRECIGQCTWVTGVNGTQICGMSGMFVVKDTDFCSYGERRDS